MEIVKHHAQLAMLIQLPINVKVRVWVQDCMEIQQQILVYRYVLKIGLGTMVYVWMIVIP